MDLTGGGKGGFCTENNSAYFKNSQCEYFPCHKTENEHFNCLFCYCPLYALGENCGGNFTYTKTGVKDCSGCLVPHSADGYAYIQSKLAALGELAKKKE